MLEHFYVYVREYLEVRNKVLLSMHEKEWLIRYSSNMFNIGKVAFVWIYLFQSYKTKNIILAWDTCNSLKGKLMMAER